MLLKPKLGTHVPINTGHSSKSSRTAQAASEPAGVQSTHGGGLPPSLHRHQAREPTPAVPLQPGLSLLTRSILKFRPSTFFWLASTPSQLLRNSGRKAAKKPSKSTEAML